MKYSYRATIGDNATNEDLNDFDVSNIKRWLGDQTFAECCERFDTEGYIIFENVLSAQQVQAIRTALEPHLTATGRNDFEGFKSNRVYALLAKEPRVFSEMVMHPLVMPFVERDLGASCLLSALLAINLQPGETVQDWHYDDGNIYIPLPRPSFGVSAFWSIDDTTATNGATEIIPGSHLWTADQRPTVSSLDEMHDQRERDPQHDPHRRDDSIKATMPSGSLMLTKGTLFHRGGANLSDDARLIVTPQYCAGWARQLENMFLAVPPEVASELPERVRELVGYSIHGSFMGYVDGRHPAKTLGIKDAVR